MSYPCFYNYHKNCDSCEECHKTKQTACPICGEELYNDDELYFCEHDDKIIGCTHCVYTQLVENYETN